MNVWLGSGADGGALMGLGGGHAKVWEVGLPAIGLAAAPTASGGGVGGRSSPSPGGANTGGAGWAAICARDGRGKDCVAFTDTTGVPAAIVCGGVKGGMGVGGSPKDGGGGGKGRVMRGLAGGIAGGFGGATGTARTPADPGRVANRGRL